MKGNNLVKKKNILYVDDRKNFETLENKTRNKGFRYEIGFALKDDT